MLPSIRDLNFKCINKNSKCEGQDSTNLKIYEYMESALIGPVTKTLHTAQLHSCFATSQEDKCNMLYMRLPSKITQKLQLVQNVLMQAVMSIPCSPHITCLICELPWLPMDFHVQLKVTCISLHGMRLFRGPPLSSFFCPFHWIQFHLLSTAIWQGPRSVWLLCCSTFPLEVQLCQHFGCLLGHGIWNGW